MKLKAYRPIAINEKNIFRDKYHISSLPSKFFGLTFSEFKQRPESIGVRNFIGLNELLQSLIQKHARVEEPQIQ